MILLALDGAWRGGATPQQIVEMIEAKQTKNEARSWPDWRTAPEGKAICHIKEEEAEIKPKPGSREEFDSLKPGDVFESKYGNKYKATSLSMDGTIGVENAWTEGIGYFSWDCYRSLECRKANVGWLWATN